ncbi:unnamed protein product [Sympodiomycopsis kandeliae]
MSSSTPLASTSRLAPLTRTDSISSSRDTHSSTYYSRMGGLSRSSSMSSNGSAFSRRGSMSAAAGSQEPVIRNGFVIPKITLTPPDEKPQRSEALPWQDYTSKSTLYVPVKTEDIGWEEGGLWWHGKFEYREVSLYGGNDDHVVGKYRGGPEGYAYTEIWDQQGFDYQPPRKNHEPAPQKPTPSASRSSSSSSSKRSSSSRASIDSTGSSSKRSVSSATGSDPAKESQSRNVDNIATSKETVSQYAKSTTSTAVESSSAPSVCSSRRNSDASSMFNSTPSSRRTSDSSYSIDTTHTTPCDSPLQRSSFSSLLESDDLQMKDSPIEGAAPFSKLEQALLALKAEKLHAGNLSECSKTDATLDSQLRLQSGKSFTLSLDGPSASHSWPKGRGVAKIAERPN